MNPREIIYEIGNWSFKESKTFKMKIEKCIMDNLYGYEPVLVKINTDNKDVYYLLKSLGFWYYKDGEFFIKIFNHIQDQFVKNDINRGYIIIKYLQ